MDDNKPDEAGAPPAGGSRKRPPPTIELTAADVSESPRPADEASAAAPDGDQSEQAAPEDGDANNKPSPRKFSTRSRLLLVTLLTSAATGAFAAGLVLGAAYIAGWQNTATQPVVSPPVATNDASARADIAALGARVAKVESNAATTASSSVDAAVMARIDGLEKSIASLKSDIAAARGQSDKAVAALDDLKSAPRDSAAPAADVSTIEQRLDKVEQATVALSAVANAPAPQPPTEDPALRRVAAATLLDSLVRQGEPYAAALTAAKSLASNANTLKPLEAFAATGVPSSRVLLRELEPLLPKLAPKPETAAAPTGMFDRLRQSAAKLVRIERTDVAAGGNGAVIARVAAAAGHSDLDAAKRALMEIPAADRTPVQSWIEKVDARDAALAASRQFASDTMTALSAPAR
ncbi:hypothetical protein [Bradyrhizobium sp. SYSU BS000235]|uniref:COG4223 family protein n=1 Tax=Bradyrhizobium sp. SYSU BS000235 TaxID=3411332 RepID=UPI003C727BF5